MSLAHIEPILQSTETLAEPHLRLVSPLVEQPIKPPSEPPVEPPLVLAVAERAEDMWACWRAERLFKAVGKGALATEVTVEAVETTHTLADTIQAAAEGDEEANQRLEMNASTDLVERAYKAGFVIDIPLKVHDDGTVEQYGQTTSMLYGNTLTYANDNPKMQPRAEAETRNGYRIEELNREGWFEAGYSMVVMSRVPINMTRQELKDSSFFDETMSIAIQVTRGVDEGELQVQAGFVAGVKEAGGERHDGQAIVDLAADWGVDYEGLDPTEIIDYPILVHNSLIPNGVIDVAALLDQKIPGQSFFGQDKPTQDYLAFREECRQQQASFVSLTKEIANQLKAEAAELTDPVDAIRRLDELSEEKLLLRSLEDHTIDPRVFGPKAAPYITEARMAMHRGDMQKVWLTTQMALKLADSSSCPSGLRKKDTSPEQDSPLDKPEGLEDKELGQEELDCKEVKDGALVNCPFCKQKVRAIVPEKGGKIYCSNGSCEAAHSSAKSAQE